MAQRQRSKGMGTLYQRDGRGPFIARWYDESGRRREASTGTTDRRTAERILAKRIADAALVKQGVVDRSEKKSADAARKPVSIHLSDFIAGLKTTVTAQQAQQLETRIERLFKLAGVETISDISMHAVQVAIGAIRKGGDIGKDEKPYRPASIQTCTHYLRAVKQFTRWLRRDQRVRNDPLADMSAVGKAETDRRHVRRTFFDEELDLLIQAAETGPAVRKMAGVDRAMMYRVAIGTGLRAKEVRSLTPESFDLDSAPPTVTVDAAHTKNREAAVQPIRPELAKIVAKWLKGKKHGQPVFSYKSKAVNLLKADLAAARKAWIGEAQTDAERERREKSSFLAYKDESGAVVDFHSFRHSYVSRIVAGGASVKVAMQLARHESAELTIGRYAHTRLHDLTGALSGLPCPAPVNPEPELVQLSATGTEDLVGKCDQRVDDHRLYPRQLGRETAGSGGNGREASLDLGPKNAVSDPGRKKSPGRGNRGHRLAIARYSSYPGRGKPG